MPSGVVTDMLPEVPLPTTAVMLVGLLTVNDAASTPPNFTEVTLVRLLVVRLTVSPRPADEGLKPVIPINLKPDLGNDLPAATTTI